MTTAFDSLSRQQETVYSALRTGRPLTNLIALTTLGIQSLSKRVSELNAKGLKAELKRHGLMITTLWKKDHAGRRYVSHQIVDLVASE